MNISELQSSQKRRTVLGVLIFFVVGIGGPLAVIFGTDLRQIFVDEPTPGGIAALLAIVIFFPSIAMGFVNRVSGRFAAETFDPFFAFLKFEARRYLNGRQYHGTWKGRRVDIYLHPVQRQQYVPLTTGVPLRLTAYDGHFLEIFVDAKVDTHFGLAAGQRVPTMKSDLELSGMDVSFVRAKDSAWAKAALTSKPVASALQDLLSSAKAVPMVSVAGMPKAVVFKTHLPKAAFSQKVVEGWVNGILAVAEGLEVARKPAVMESETTMERWTREDRRSLHMMGGVGCLLGLAILLGGIGGLVWVLQG